MRSVRILVLALVLAGCKKSADPVVARLEQMNAKVERMPREAAPWQPARIGDGFIIGSAVRTGSASTAKLRVGKNGKLDVEQNAVVYFTRNVAHERNDLRVESGVAELETGDETIGMGKAVLDPGTHVRVEATPQGTSLVVTVGRATLDDTVIGAGQQITVGSADTAVAAVDAGVTAPPDGQIAVAVRDKAARAKRAGGGFMELSVGEHGVEPGTELSVPAGSTIEIHRNGAHAIASGPAELRVGAKGTVDVISGIVGIHADSADAFAGIPGGSVTTGGSAAVNVEAKSTAVDALRGATAITTARGTTPLEAGQSAKVTTAGDVAVVPAPPARTVATISAGESATLHDPKAPTPVRVAFDQVCPAGGTLEVASDRSFKRIVARAAGAATANALVPAGSFAYRVRGPGGKGATGTLRVVKDSGRTPLPKAAARTTVDMDGREYTILYQNLLPELTLAWKTAPRSSKYTFVIKPTRGADKRVANAASKLELRPGELKEGSYKVWVEADGNRRSEESRIVIEFDNAAQSASIDAVETAGAGVRVRGTVIESSTVAAGGAPIDLDRHRRFNTELTPREGEDAVSVRIAHPKAGIHYYVLRSAPP